MKIYIIFSFFDSYLKNDKKKIEKKSNFSLMYLKNYYFFNNLIIEFIIIYITY